MIIGLTGGIASGKSTAAAYLKSKGAVIVDGDQLGHRAYEPDTQAFGEVVETFGPETVGADGQIDRKVLGGKVFGNPEALNRLTDILWPQIRRLAEAEIREYRAESPARHIVVDAAVMLEAGWQDMVEEVWVVFVDPDVAVARAMARDGANEEAIRKRIASQLSNEERCAQADVIIENSADEAAFQARFDAEWNRISTL